VILGGMPIFMYEDDLGYLLLPDSAKCAMSGLSPQQMMAKRHLPPAAALEGTAIGRCVQRLITTYLDHLLIDIGCQYGTSALHLAYFARKHGSTGPVFAFDPGDAGSLASINIAMNKDMGEVQFFSCAVGAFSGYTLLYSELGNSENNRVGNRGPASRSRPTRITSVDNFLETHCGFKPAFLKIDTQGFDPEVVDGAERLLNGLPTILHIEFVPHAVKPRRSPEDFLRRLLADFILLEDKGSHGEPIKEDQIYEFTRSIDASETRWTDLICISRKLPWAEEICAAISTHGVA
jgi:FkbM family methyltransferase